MRGLLLFTILILFLSQLIYAQDKNLPYIEDSIKFIFNINENEILNTQEIILILCIFFIVLILIHNILNFTPYFEGLKSWILALIVSILAGVAGVYRKVAQFFFISLKNYSDYFRKNEILISILVVLVLFFIFFGINKIIKIFKKYNEIEKAEELGMKTGAALKKLRLESGIDED